MIQLEKIYIISHFCGFDGFGFKLKQSKLVFNGYKFNQKHKFNVNPNKTKGWNEKMSNIFCIRDCFLWFLQIWFQTEMVKNANT